MNKVEQYSPTAGIKLADSRGPAANANTNKLLSSFWPKFTSSYSNKKRTYFVRFLIFSLIRLSITTYFNINNKNYIIVSAAVRLSRQ